MKRDSGGALARFATIKAEPKLALSLADDHPAVVEGRTLFPTRVKSPAEAGHLLVDGKNNAKIGGLITKGPWKGLPAFTLTLEERKTCPRSCAVWNSCYGSGMPFPKRWDHTDPEFLPLLALEVKSRLMEHPGGIVVRLHVLGDFYSVDYVGFWRQMLFQHPALRVYGYTANRIDGATVSERAIATELAVMTNTFWDRFAIRFSHSAPGPGRTIVVDEPPTDPAVILCPVQTDQTQTCGTCALCWAEPARGKTIAFLRHGMTRHRKKEEIDMAAPEAPKPRGRPPKDPEAKKRLAWGKWEGTAAESLTTTPEERLAAVSDAERAAIAARYGATFKAKP